MTAGARMQKGDLELALARLAGAVETLAQDVKDMALAQKETDKFLFRGNGGTTVRERLAVLEMSTAKLEASVENMALEWREWRDKPSPAWAKMAVIGGWLFGFLAFAINVVKSLAQGGVP